MEDKLSGSAKMKNEERLNIYFFVGRDILFI